MMVDLHCHLLNEEGYLENLVREAKKLGMSKICLNGLGSLYDELGNEEVKQAFLKYPQLIMGFGHLRLGKDSVEKVDEIYQAGFRGLKVINPTKNYDDKDFYPYYARAEKHRMSILFHTGMVKRTNKDKLYDISSERMRPIYLDTIARAFPDLTLIGAHLGGPWFREAADVLRFNPNVYFDITGSISGWVRKTPDFFRNYLWWKGAWDKIVFGSDVHFSQIKTVMANYRRVLETLKVNKATQKKVFGETAIRVLNMKVN
ncbi:MAG: amidohydrolase family protein [Candidatus Aminicenantales bacterium]